ncbi:MAG: hypothetical protein ACMUJM_14015 [bacterium]
MKGKIVFYLIIIMLFLALSIPTAMAQNFFLPFTNPLFFFPPIPLGLRVAATPPAPAPTLTVPVLTAAGLTLTSLIPTAIAPPTIVPAVTIVLNLTIPVATIAPIAPVATPLNIPLI